MCALRNIESEDKYQKLAPELLKKGCPLCLKTPEQTFTHWKIVTNDFPYDKIAKTHHMITPLRHVSEQELSDDEKKELQDIKGGYLNTHYEYIIEPTHKKKSIPAHFHLHLIV